MIYLGAVKVVHPEKLFSDEVVTLLLRQFTSVKFHGI